MLTGPNTFRFSKTITQENGFMALDSAMKDIKNRLAKKGIKTHLTIWKDFKVDEPKDAVIPNVESYYKFSTQPNMVLDIRENWQSEQNYVSDLNKKYRDQYKRARKKHEGIVKRKLSLAEIKAHNDHIYELYFNVAKNAPFNTFWLARNHFVALKELLQERFLFYGYFLGDDLIGFDTLIKNGTSMDTYFLGYDENCQRDKMLYLNMLYNMIGYSIKKNYKKVIFARTALEIKSSVGAKPVNLYGYIRHSNTMLNAMMPKLFPYFEPEMIWKERHPFKDAERPV
jgi:predicted N-acyltransferase